GDSRLPFSGVPGMADEDRETAVRRISELCQRLGEITADVQDSRLVIRSGGTSADRRKLPERRREVGVVECRLVKDHREDPYLARGAPVTVDDLLDVGMPRPRPTLNAGREPGSEHGNDRHQLRDPQTVRRRGTGKGARPRGVPGPAPAMAAPVHFHGTT